jgi:hypothetical protein
MMTQAPEAPADPSADLVEEMFVHTARSVSSEGGTLTLHGLTPSTLYFSDRPERVVGHMTTEQFVKMWSQGPNSFLEDPPNAVLSWVEPGDEAPEDAVIVLRDPVAGDDSITYSIQVLDGAVPAQAGAVSLFIDPFGRPLSPVSVAGMRRRERRRDVRRF